MEPTAVAGGSTESSGDGAGRAVAGRRGRAAGVGAFADRRAPARGVRVPGERRFGGACGTASGRSRGSEEVRGLRSRTATETSRSGSPETPFAARPGPGRRSRRRPAPDGSERTPRRVPDGEDGPSDRAATAGSWRTTVGDSVPAAGAFECGSAPAGLRRSRRELPPILPPAPRPPVRPAPKRDIRCRSTSVAVERSFRSLPAVDAPSANTLGARSRWTPPRAPRRPRGLRRCGLRLSAPGDPRPSLAGRPGRFAGGAAVEGGRRRSAPSRRRESRGGRIGEPGSCA